MKSYLLLTAAKKSYFQLPPPELEKLWQVSDQFIEHKRLTCFEYEWFTLVEQHFYLSMLTGHDVHVKQMLKRITDKFGADSRRVLKLKTAYAQATETKEGFQEFQKQLSETDFDARKIAMVPLKSSGNIKEFIKVLLEYLTNDNPCDAEGWSELGETYAECGDFGSAIGCFEQVLVLEPMAFNVFARIGELKKLQAAQTLSTNFALAKSQIESSIDFFCRSVELNPNFVRGWCGLLATTAISMDETSNELHERARKELGRFDDDIARKMLSFHA